MKPIMPMCLRGPMWVRKCVCVGSPAPLLAGVSVGGQAGACPLNSGTRASVASLLHINKENLPSWIFHLLKIAFFLT